MSEVQQSENNNEETLPLSPDCVQKKITSGMIEILVGCNGPKKGASLRWSFRPNSAWGSLETTVIGKTHPTLNWGAW